MPDCACREQQWAALCNSSCPVGLGGMPVTPVIRSIRPNRTPAKNPKNTKTHKNTIKFLNFDFWNLKFPPSVIPL
jgi:hypothetical protein